jgi:hypothetical protein
LKKREREREFAFLIFSSFLFFVKTCFLLLSLSLSRFLSLFLSLTKELCFENEQNTQQESGEKKTVFSFITRHANPESSRPGSASYFGAACGVVRG